MITPNVLMLLSMAWCATRTSWVGSPFAACWEAFEADHPGMFGGMYIFWVQKPSDAASI